MEIVDPAGQSERQHTELREEVCRTPVGGALIRGVRGQYGPGQISELATVNAHIAIGVKDSCTLARGLSTVKQLICLATEVSAICNENRSLSPSQIAIGSWTAYSKFTPDSF